MDFSLTAEQEQLVNTASELATNRLVAAEANDEHFAWTAAKILAMAGFTGITLPVEDGGQGGSMLDAILVIDAVTRVAPRSGDVVQATNFGAIRQVATLGTPRLKAEVLPVLLSGDGLISAGMSEPDAGSALTDLRTTARYDGDDVVLDGEKCWNSHGPEITHVVVWCRFGPSTRDIGAVVVPADAPGFSRGPAQTYMSGERHCSLYFDGCRVPRHHVLADSGALQTLLGTFGVERMGNASRAVAMAEAAFSAAVQHAKERRQFGRRLCEFQGIQWKFADMRVKLDSARLLIHRAIVNAQAGRPDPVEAAIAKASANEVAFAVASEAMQVFGAAGYDTALPMEYYLRRIRGWMIAGGSVEMMRNSIAQSVFGERFPQRAPK